MKIINQAASSPYRIIAKIIPPKQKIGDLFVNSLSLVKADKQIDGHTSYAEITSLPDRYLCTEMGLVTIMGATSIGEVRERWNEFCYPKVFKERQGRQVEESEHLLKGNPFNFQVGDIIYFKYSDIEQYFEKGGTHLVCNGEDIKAYKRNGITYGAKGYKIGVPYEREAVRNGILLTSTGTEKVGHHFKSDQIYLTNTSHYPYFLNEDFEKIYYCWEENIIGVFDGGYFPYNDYIFVEYEMDGIKTTIKNFIDPHAKPTYRGKVLSGELKGEKVQFCTLPSRRMEIGNKKIIAIKNHEIEYTL